MTYTPGTNPKSWEDWAFGPSVQNGTVYTLSDPVNADVSGWQKTQVMEKTLNEGNPLFGQRGSQMQRNKRT